VRDIFALGARDSQCRADATLIARTARDIWDYRDGPQRLLAFTGRAGFIAPR